VAETSQKFFPKDFVEAQIFKCFIVSIFKNIQEKRVFSYFY